MSGFIALIGGDEFRPGCEEMDRLILETSSAKRPSLLIVPTAAQDPFKAAANGVSYFSKLNTDVSALMVMSPEDVNDESRLSAVDTADVIYFTGGNTTYLLDTLEESLMLQKIKQALLRGATLVGSSAGAMILGSWVRLEFWRKGLGIVNNVAVLPHHEGLDPDIQVQSLGGELPSDLVVFGIDAKTCCLGRGREWRVVGDGRIIAYREGCWRQVSSTRSFVH